MVLLLLFIAIIAIFFSMQSKKMEKMKKETPNAYLLTNSLSYGIVFLIVALTASKGWVITIAWIIVAVCLITTITAIRGYFKKV